MPVSVNNILRDQLLDRRQKLAVAVTAVGMNLEIKRLMQEVDSALERMGGGNYGLCEVCHDPIESERLIADPLTRYCLDHLTPEQQQALATDLELAARIQRGLLPDRRADYGPWKTAYHYEPAQYTSGDYCDLLRDEAGNLYFILGDVSGKGVAASILMSHLHAMFRTLIPLGLPLCQIVERAGRIFCESTLPSQYATLVVGKAEVSGRVELCNAGHLPLLLNTKGVVNDLSATGLPLGMFCDEQYNTTVFETHPGDTILLYSDGLTEAQDETGDEFGVDRLKGLMQKNERLSAEDLVRACLSELSIFQFDAPKKDDLTILVIQRPKNV
jgi:phosphoserine phosphatase RsbU/P